METTFKEIVELWTKDLSIDNAIITLFEKVRDIPYGSIGSRDPLEVFKQQKGTCSGKHELLKNLYKVINIPVKDFIIMHSFNELAVDFSEDVQKILNTVNIIDPHNFIKIKRDNKWITVDVTWDIGLEDKGFPVNEHWDGKSSMQIAVTLGGEIYETTDPMTLKTALIRKMPQNDQLARELFLKTTTAWLSTVRVN